MPTSSSEPLNSLSAVRNDGELLSLADECRRDVEWRTHPAVLRRRLRKTIWTNNIVTSLPGFRAMDRSAGEIKRSNISNTILWQRGFGSCTGILDHILTAGRVRLNTNCWSGQGRKRSSFTTSPTPGCGNCATAQKNSHHIQSHVLGCACDRLARIAAPYRVARPVLVLGRQSPRHQGRHSATARGRRSVRHL